MGTARRSRRERAGAEMPERKPARSALFILVLTGPAVLLLCWPLLSHENLPRGSDVFAITHYLAGFRAALAEGSLVPGWCAETNLGLGGPAFVLFPPLFFYAGSAAAWAAGGLLGGLKLYLLAVAVAGAASFYLLAREWAGPGLPAAAGAAMYTLLPYHVLDMYQRFAMPETTAFVFLPLILLFARRVLRGGGGGSVAGLAISYALLVGTHLVSTLLFSVLLVPWMLWECRSRWRELAVALAALALGAAVAAPAVVPAMIEKSHVNIDWVKEMPNGDFRINFLFKDDVLPIIGFKDPVKPLVLASAHAQLLLAAAAAVLALAAGAGGDPGRRRLIAGVAAGCGIAYFLQLRLSTPVWLAVPELPTIQFPWRFQSVMVLATSLLAAFALAAPVRPGRRKAAWAILALLAVPNFVLAVQFAHAKPFDFDQRTLSYMAGPLAWKEPALTPVQFGAYRRLKFEDLTLPGDGFVNGKGSVELAGRSTASRRLEITSAEGGTVRARLFWFPGWKGSLDGQPLEVAPYPADGLVSFQSPPGRHTVDLSFRMTPVRKASWWMAGIALAGVAFAAATLRPRALG